MRRNSMRRSIAIAFCAWLVATPALAQMTCAALGSYLATQPNISQFVPPPPAAQVPVPFTTLVPATAPNAARCEAKFIYSARGGPASGYAVGQNQRIGIVVGFPLNTLDGGSGAVQGAWNGRVRNIGGGGPQGKLSPSTAARNTRHGPSHRKPGLRRHPGYARAQLRHAGRLPGREHPPAIQMGARVDPGLLRHGGDAQLLGRLLDRRG